MLLFMIKIYINIEIFNTAFNSNISILYNKTTKQNCLSDHIPNINLSLSL